MGAELLNWISRILDPELSASRGRLGRLIAIILTTVRIGLFDTFTGYMAIFLISTNREDGKK
jgi:hypothetical protein